MSANAVKELAPSGVLRAAINMSNFLLVSGRSHAGEPQGVSPDMARAVADKLGVDVHYVQYASPGELADDAGNDIWDIGLIGAEPQRAQKIEFSPAYVEIESTYLVPAGSPLKSVKDVDVAGVRIATTARTAYDLWLERNIKHATLIRTTTVDGAFDAFVEQRLEALAGLRPRLLSDVEKLPGARLLPDQFAAVQQAIGTSKGRPAAAAFIREFVEEAKATGFVAELIARHEVRGLSVAPKA